MEQRQPPPASSSQHTTATKEKPSSWTGKPASSGSGNLKHQALRRHVAFGFCILCAAIPLSRRWIVSSQSAKTDSATLFFASSSPSVLPLPAGGLPSCPYYDDIPSPFPASFWYVKNYKTASSTLGGVMRSIAAHHGPIDVLASNESITPSKGGSIDSELLFFSGLQEIRQTLESNYKTNDHVGLATHLRFSRKVVGLFRQPFLAFSSVREPISRFHSYAVQVCLRAASVSKQEVLAFKADQPGTEEEDDRTTAYKLKAEKKKNCSLPNIQSRREIARDMVENPQYEYLRNYHDQADAGEEAESIESVAAAYDFLFVQERLYESLVAFAILYGLDFEDIAHVPSKVRTGTYADAKDISNDEMHDLVSAKSRKDLALWQHANALLDEKIATIEQHCGGADAGYFGEMLEIFNKIQAAVGEECGNYEEWYEEHGFGNTPLAYWRDNGIAPRCRDYVVRNMRRKGELEIADTV